MFNIVFDAPIDPASISPQAFDPYLFVRNTSYEIHLIGKTLAGQRATFGYTPSVNSAQGQTDFVDSNGFPFGMLLVSPWQPPIESRSMEVAYPDFADFVLTRGNQKKDWYLRPDAAKVHASEQFIWQW